LQKYEIFLDFLHITHKLCAHIKRVMLSDDDILLQQKAFHYIQKKKLKLQIVFKVLICKVFYLAFCFILQIND